MERAHRRKWLWRTVLVTALTALGLLYALIALYLPSQGMARHLCEIAAERYGIRCRLQKVSLRFGPRFIEAVRLVDLTIFDPGTGEVLLQSKEIRVIPRLSPGGQEGWIGVKGIEVEEPVLHLRRTKSGRWNLQEILAAPEAGQSAFPLPHRITIHQGTLWMDGTAFSGIELFAEVDPEGTVQVTGHGSYQGVKITAAGKTHMTAPLQRLTGKIQVEESFPSPLLPVLKKGSLRAILELDGRRWPLIEGSALLAGSDLVTEGGQALGSPVLHASLLVDPFTGSGEARALTLSDRGWRVRGSGTIQPSGQKGYAYRLLVQEAGLHLSEMRFLFPNLPDLQLQATAGRIHGGFSLRGGGWLLQGEASLQSRMKSPWFPREDPVAIEAAWTGESGGDLQVTRLQFQGSSLGALRMTAVLKAWGQKGIRFRSEELHLQPALMHAILSRLTPGIQIEQISKPEISGTLSSFQGPLDLHVLVGELTIGVGGHSLLFQGAEGMFHGEGKRWEGAGRALRVSTPFGDMQGVETELFGQEGMLAIRRMGLQLSAHPPLHFTGDGTVQWKGETTTLEMQGDIHRSPSSKGGRLKLLVAVKRSSQRGWDSQGRVSADAQGLLDLVRWYRDTPLWASQGRLTADWEGVIPEAETISVSGQIHVEDVDLGFSRAGDSSRPFLTGVKGAIPFHLRGGRWLIPRTTLESRHGLSFSLQGNWDQHQGVQMDFDLPRTPVAHLAPFLQAFLPSGVEGRGAVEARGSWTGKGLAGELLLDQVHLQAGGLFLTEVNGKIPLGSMTPSIPPLQTHWPEFTAEVHQRAQQEMQSQPPQPKTLAIKALGYQGLAVRDMILHLVPGDRKITINPLTFQVYGGRGWGKGELDLAAAAARLALLFDDISLTGLLDQFPPLRGYLSGRVDGLVEMVVPLSDPAKARGRGRWWVVKSPQEERIISQEMIERLGGPPARFFQILTGRNRAYDVGVLAAVLDHGYLFFPELEISHRILGMKDLEIRVVPPFNRIALDHLLSSILEAMERARGSTMP
jgi:hypothetical protein